MGTLICPWLVNETETDLKREWGGIILYKVERVNQPTLVKYLDLFIYGDETLVPIRVCCRCVLSIVYIVCRSRFFGVPLSSYKSNPSRMHFEWNWIELKGFVFFTFILKIDSFPVCSVVHVDILMIFIIINNPFSS